jgi:hypothetical protein
LPDSPNDPTADLQAHFPAVLGKSSDKWWSLSVARLSATDRYQTLGAAETATRLERVIRLSIPDRNGTPGLYTLDDYFLKFPASAPEDEPATSPPWRSSSSFLSRDRAGILPAHGTSRARPDATRSGSGSRASRVSYRQAVEHQARDIDDYMNWYEATQPKTLSGAFSQYLDAVSAADAALPRGRDPISIYLDSVKMQTE